MDERWVCLRCFTSNEGSAFNCVQCGLLRGATPAPGEVQAMSAARRRQLNPLLGLALRFWWVGAVVLVAVGGYIFNAQRSDSGEITRGGNMAVTELRVGDCFNVNEASDQEVENVTAVRCDETHQYEMFLVETMASATYPGPDGFVAFVGDRCLASFAAFVGLAYEQSVLDLFWFEPTAESWDAGDRTVQCAVYDPANAQLTTSLRGAVR